MRYNNMVEISGQDIFEQRGQVRKFRTGQLLAERGAEAQRLFYIQEGLARAFFLSPEGDEITLFYIDAGNMCCTESLVSHPKYIVSIEAVSHVTAFSIDPDTFLQEWEGRGYSVKDLLSHFVRRILLLSDYLCCMRFHKSISRLAYFLYSSCEDGQRYIYFTHSEIARLTGMSPITVNRGLKQLKEEGILQCEYQKVKIVDRRRLLEYFSSMGYVVD